MQFVAAAAVVERKGDVALCYVVTSSAQQHQGEEEEELVRAFLLGPSKAERRAQFFIFCSAAQKKLDRAKRSTLPLGRSPPLPPPQSLGSRANA